MRSFWLLAAIVALTVVLYASTFYELARTWVSNENCGHGFLIIPASLYLAWHRRRRVANRPLCPSRLGIPVMAIWAGLYLLGTGARIMTLACFSFIVFVPGVLLCTAGRRITRIMLFPAAFLAFMIPIPSEVYSLVTSPLQLTTTGLSSLVLGWLGIPVLKDGILIHLPNCSMQVATACSGLRSLVFVMALSVLMGYLFFSSNIERALLFMLAVPAAVLGNVLRITLTGLMAYTAAPGTVTGLSHLMAGMLTFCLSFALLFGAAVLIRWIERERMQYISWYLR
ncbi:MAG: exosortase/archaeosortase family protein [Desulfomonilia bacterium]